MTYQFSIRLSGFRNPEVWRRIEIPSSYTFYQFHKVLSIAFGKTHKINTYTFSPPGKNATPRILSIDMFFHDSLYSKTTLLSEIFKSSGQHFLYVSDSNETRTHHILLEKIEYRTISYAQCLNGEGAYPPEMCTGADDYEDIKVTLSDKNCAQHEDILNWFELNEGETWESKYHFERSKVNEQLMSIDAEIKSFRNYTIVRYDTFDKMYGLTPAHWREIDKKREEFNGSKNWKTINSELQKLINANPAIPHFKNTLASAYRLQKKEALYLQTAMPLMTEYPDYIMTRCGLINYYTEEKQFDKAKALIGDNFDLNELYPNRNGNFTDVEVAHYQVGVIRYLIQNDDIEEARKHFDYLEYVLPKARDLEVVRLPLNMAAMQKSMKEEVKEKMIEVIPEKILSSETPTDFENPYINMLYLYNNSINRDILHQIIELPRESVIRDLGKILIDSVANLDFYKENYDVNSTFAPLHALSLLSVMQAEEALDTLFKILRQDEKYYDFWYGVIITENFWQFIYGMGQNRLERLKDFIFEPNRYRYARIAVCTVLKYLAYHQPERKDEILKWYQEALQNMLDHQNDTDVFDHFVYRSLFGDLINIAGREHLQLVLPLYVDSLVEERERLSVFDIKVRLSKPLSEVMIRPVHATVDQYYDMWEKWFRNDKSSKQASKRDFAAQNNTKDTPATKTGRNDPCPCGSGKKFKKCCASND